MAHRVLARHAGIRHPAVNLALFRPCGSPLCRHHSTVYTHDLTPPPNRHLLLLAQRPWHWEPWPRMTVQKAVGHGMASLAKRMLSKQLEVIVGNMDPGKKKKKKKKGERIDLAAVDAGKTEVKWDIGDAIPAEDLALILRLRDVRRRIGKCIRWGCPADKLWLVTLIVRQWTSCSERIFPGLHRSIFNVPKEFGANRRGQYADTEVTMKRSEKLSDNTLRVCVGDIRRKWISHVFPTSCAVSDKRSTHQFTRVYPKEATRPKHMVISSRVLVSPEWKHAWERLWKLGPTNECKKNPFARNGAEWEAAAAELGALQQNRRTHGSQVQLHCRFPFVVMNTVYSKDAAEPVGVTANEYASLHVMLKLSRAVPLTLLVRSQSRDQATQDVQGQFPPSPSDAKARAGFFSGGIQRRRDLFRIANRLMVCLEKQEQNYEWAKDQAGKILLLVEQLERLTWAAEGAVEDTGARPSADSASRREVAEVG